MSNRVWTAEAPANIALIKYMGKTPSLGNIPVNGSLSYTLDHLVTRVELEVSDKPYDSWEPLSCAQFHSIQLSDAGQKRFLAHLKELKDLYLFQDHFVVRSCNNFPADAGVASSASSFAALTKAAVKALGDLTYRDRAPPPLTEHELAKLSRRGSGSSCRSFFSGWVEWEGEAVSPWSASNYQDLWHVLAVVEQGQKSVSSSHAHQRVTSSLLFKGRPERATLRKTEFMSTLMRGDWKSAKEVAWAEFWDMHALFATAQPSFGYMTAGSLKALQIGQQQWVEFDKGPIMTMDAGANVHFLFQREDHSLAFDLLRETAEYGITQSNLETVTTGRHGLL